MAYNGVSVYFYNVISKEEYDKYMLEEKNNWQCNYEEFDYEPQLGNIQTYSIKTEYYDIDGAFRDLKINPLYYLEYNSDDENTLLYVNQETDNPNDNIIFDKNKLSRFTETDIKFYVKYVKSIYIMDKKSVNQMITVSTLTNYRFITKPRLFELMQYIPKLKKILCKKYKLTNDFEFDLMSISW